MATIGKSQTLSILRESAHGLYLDGGPLGEILLPRRYVPRDVIPGDQLEVFVYLDSEDRLVATTEVPLAQVGDIASLEVVSVNQRVGAFLNWGLPKDLLLPFREINSAVRPGQKVVVLVKLDERSNRIIASSRLPRQQNRANPPYQPGQRVNLIITRQTDLGYEAIIENQHRGLLYRDQLPGPLRLGQELVGYVRTIRPEGKIDLSLDASGYKRIAPVQQQILGALEQNGGRLALDDNSPPEAIRRAFGVSKKAFKQALGALYKHRHIRFLNPGIELVREGAA